MKTSSELKIISQFQSNWDKILNVHYSARISMKSIGIIGWEKNLQEYKIFGMPKVAFLPRYNCVFTTLRFFRIFPEIMRQTMSWHIFIICNINQPFELYCGRTVIMIWGLSESHFGENGISCKPELIFTKHSAFYNDSQTVKFAVGLIRFFDNT